MSIQSFLGWTMTAMEEENDRKDHGEASSIELVVVEVDILICYSIALLSQLASDFVEIVSHIQLIMI